MHTRIPIRIYIMLVRVECIYDQSQYASLVFRQFCFIPLCVFDRFSMKFFAVIAASLPCDNASASHLGRAVKPLVTGGRAPAGAFLGSRGHRVRLPRGSGPLPTFQVRPPTTLHTGGPTLKKPVVKSHHALSAVEVRPPQPTHVPPVLPPATPTPSRPNVEVPGGRPRRRPLLHHIQEYLANRQADGAPRSSSSPGSGHDEAIDSGQLPVAHVQPVDVEGEEEADETGSRSEELPPVADVINDAPAGDDSAAIGGAGTTSTFSSDPEVVHSPLTEPDVDPIAQLDHGSVGGAATRSRQPPLMRSGTPTQVLEWRIANEINLIASRTPSSSSVELTTAHIELLQEMKRAVRSVWFIDSPDAIKLYHRILTLVVDNPDSAVIWDAFRTLVDKMRDAPLEVRVADLQAVIETKSLVATAGAAETVTCSNCVGAFSRLRRKAKAGSHRK